MVDRILLWVCAGVLAAGVSAATIAGAGLAAAEDGAAADTGANTSSESANSTGTKKDSDTSKPDPDPEPDDDATNDTAVGSDDNEDAQEEVADPAQPDEEEDTDESATPDSDTASDEPTTVPQDTDTKQQTDDTTRADGPAAALPETDDAISNRLDKAEAVTPEPDDETAAELDVAKADEPVVATVEPMSLVADTADPPVADTAVTPLAVAAPEPAAVAPTQPTLINIIGTLVWSVLDFIVTLAEGPPAVPPGSTVRVGRSTLEIDCGDGYTAGADWYFPTAGPAPTKLIYFQHGALARAGLYNFTAAELAERNNAIVVAPSITSNFFACDGCLEGGDAMHAAVARLFLGERDALLASAQAAGFEGTQLPQRFVFAGHSGGGQLAAGAAGYFAQFAPADQLHNLAGVLLLDTSAVGGAIARGVAKIPDDIPVYTIAATPHVLNSYGDAAAALLHARPNQFVGVQLVGGTHSDAWQSSNLFAQFLVGLTTGFPKPENIEAVQVIAHSWINDWYEATDTGIDGELGSTITIPTDAGFAQAYVLPAPPYQFTIIDLILNAFIQAGAYLSVFQSCAAPIGGTEAVQTAVLTQMSTPNTALTLDGRAQTGQSVGQHVCTG